MGNSPKLTIFDVNKVLWAISRVAEEGDHEAAHTLEDELHQRVLKAIAQSKCDDPAKLAKAALE
ncbi:MAG: hypothetical protein ACR2RE_07645, partial [Geminicoccaceae bacterium]